MTSSSCLWRCEAVKFVSPEWKARSDQKVTIYSVQRQRTPKWIHVQSPGSYWRESIKTDISTEKLLNVRLETLYILRYPSIRSGSSTSTPLSSLQSIKDHQYHLSLIISHLSLPKPNLQNAFLHPRRPNSFRSSRSSIKRNRHRGEPYHSGQRRHPSSILNTPTRQRHLFCKWFCTGRLLSCSLRGQQISICGEWKR